MSTTTTNFSFIKPELTDAADITQTNANWDALDNLLGNVSSVKVKTAVLHSYAWILGDDGRYYQTIEVEGVTPDTAMVLVDCDLTTDDADARVEILGAWAQPAANEATQGDGTLTFYSYVIPAVSIPIFLGVA